MKDYTPLLVLGAIAVGWYGWEQGWFGGGSDSIVFGVDDSTAAWLKSESEEMTHLAQVCQVAGGTTDTSALTCTIPMDVAVAKMTGAGYDTPDKVMSALKTGCAQEGWTLVGSNRCNIHEAKPVPVSTVATVVSLPPVPSVYNQPTVQPVTQQPSTGRTTVATTDLASRLTSLAGGATALTTDQWNYYWNSIAPSPLTAEQAGAIDQATGLSSGSAYSASVWVAAMTKALGGVPRTASYGSRSGMRGGRFIPAEWIHNGGLY